MHQSYDLSKTNLMTFSRSRFTVIVSMSTQVESCVDWVPRMLNVSKSRRR